MANSHKGKRKALPSVTISKKRKLNNGNHKKLSDKLQSKETKKIKAADRGIIPIPNLEVYEGEELSDQDMAALSDYSVDFLSKLDHTGLMRSKKETQRLHELNKPVRKKDVYDDLSIGSNSDEDTEASWDSKIEEEDLKDSELDMDDDGLIMKDKSDYSNDEMPYETKPRRLPTLGNEATKIKGLPIKLANGTVQETGTKVMIVESPAQSDDSSSDSEEEQPQNKVEDVSTGARFGRAAVVDILQTKSRTDRIEAAKNQIADICQEVLADPENSLGLLKRLHSFSLPTIRSPNHQEPISNDPTIRNLSILSQMAVFRDVIPGYRIRALTDIEKAEKVSQMVARSRDWEQGLVIIYQTYLRLLEDELKARSELATSALNCMCALLKSVTHFNFRVNLMTCLVTYLSRKSWDESSELCSQTLIEIFRNDMTGSASLEIVRILNRMIKDRQFKIHPNVLTCLLHLRLRTELGVRASNTHVDKSDEKKMKRRKTKNIHQSKREKMAAKEKKQIEKEMREAEAEVDKEERKSIQTETLKILFSLYFRILKNPTPSPLLPCALSGISRFAHLVNIDFFKDLMQVLKDLISGERISKVDDSGPRIANQLMCIVTAFELLSGQGEALNLDLTNFVNVMYSLLLSPSFSAGGLNSGMTDSLFGALNLVLFPKTATALPWRSAAFGKRLLTMSLHCASSDALRCLEIVRNLVAKDPKLESMLSTEERIFNGVYRADVDDPQLCFPFESSFWELHALHNQHWDPRVRAEAGKLLNFRIS